MCKSGRQGQHSRKHMYIKGDKKQGLIHELLLDAQESRIVSERQVLEHDLQHEVAEKEVSEKEQCLASSDFYTVLDHRYGL